MKSAIHFLTPYLLILIVFSCKPEKKPAQELVGEWKADGVPISLSIRADNSYQWVYPLGFTHGGEYHLTRDKDQILLLRRDGGELLFHFEIEGQNLIFWNYKIGKEISSHIDEVTLFLRDGKDKIIPEHTRKEIYYLDPDFTGDVQVGFEGKDQKNQEQIHIEIPSSGCVQVSHPTSIPTLAFDRYVFYRGEEEIPFIQRSKAKYLKDSYSEEELNSIFVFVDGFNQGGRDVLNYECQVYFNENVLNFRVDTLSKLLEAW
jgi:hypothetical protein